MKYIALTFAVMAFFFGLCAYILDSKLVNAEKKLNVLEAEKTALETEVRNYNEKSLQASKQIFELRQLIQKNKETDSDGYCCLFVGVPDDVLRLLNNKK